MKRFISSAATAGTFLINIISFLYELLSRHRKTPNAGKDYEKKVMLDRPVLANKNTIAPANNPWVTRVIAKLPCIPLHASAHLITFINDGIPRKYVNTNVVMIYDGNVIHP